MAVPRPLMVFRDGRRDRMSMHQQQQQGHVAAAVAAPAAAGGFQALQHMHFSRAQQRFEGGEEDGRMAAGAGGRGPDWTLAAHQHQQRAIAAAALRRERANTRQQPLPVLPNPLIRQGPGPGVQPPDWDGGGMARHMGSLSNPRMDHFLQVNDPARLRQPSLGTLSGTLSRGGEFPRGISRETYAGLRLRDSIEENRKTELFKCASGRAHMNLFDEARVEISRSYPRSAATQQQQQQPEPPSRSRGVRFGWEENGHAELIARYGDRSSSKNLERAHAAIGPAVQAGNLSRKRSRDEEADLDRERLIRHRKLSGIDTPSPPPPPPLPPLPPPTPAPIIHLKALVQKERKHEPQPKPEYNRHVQVDEDEHEEGQLTPPPPIISHKVQQHGVECKTQLFKQEQDAPVISSRTEAASKEDGNAPRCQNGFPLSTIHESSSNSRPPTANSRPPTANSRPPTANSRPPTANSRPPTANSRPPSARETVSKQADQFLHSLSPSKEQALPKLEHLPSTRFKDSERMLERLERVRAAPDESCSILASDLSDMRKKGGRKESEKHSLTLNSRSAERGHDGPHYKRQQHNVEDIPRRELRSPFDGRNMRLGGAALDNLLLERLSKESNGRVDNNVKRKIPKIGAAKDSRLFGEMTISVHKYGQRSVKVEEYKSRDTHFRVASQTNSKDHRILQRPRGVSENPFTVSAGRDRSGVPKRKDFEGRPLPTSQDKTLRSHSYKGGMTHQQHFQKPRTSQERASPFSQQVKKELLASTEIYEPEPHRHQSIFARLASSRSEPTSANPRTAVEAFRQDNSLLPVRDKASLILSSRKSPNARVQTSAGNVHRNMVDFQGSPVFVRSTRDSEGGREVVDTGLMSTKRKNPVLEWATCKQQAEPCDRPNKGSLKVETPDMPRREDSTSRQQLQSTEGRTSPFARLLLPESGREVLQKNSRLSESFVLHKPDPPKLRLESFALPSGESGPSHLLSSDIGAAEGRNQLAVNEFKSHPKVISTGHKKDQVLNKSFLNGDQAVHATLSPPITDVISVENVNQEKSEAGTSSVFGEWKPGCSQEISTLDSMGELFGSRPALDYEHASPQADLADKKPRGMDRTAEAVVSPVQSVVQGSSPSLCWPTTVQPLKPSWNSIELEQLDRSRASVSPPLIEEERAPLSEVSELHVDGEAKMGLPNAPMPSPTLSTPKEVRLFGANLNAIVGRQVELTPKDLELVNHDVADTPVLPAMDGASTLEPHVVQGLEKDICLTVLQTEDEQLVHPKEPMKADEKSMTYDDVAKEPMPLPNDFPLVQVQLEDLPSLPQEQYLPPPNLQRATAGAHGRQLSSSHSTGTHTWRRGTSSTTPGNFANIFRGRSTFGGVMQPAGRANSAQITSYVRKGNTLVRAQGSSNDGKAIAGVISGQVMPLARQFPVMKPTSFRNTFIANPAASKSFYPTHRRYVAPTVESDGALTSSVSLANAPNIPSSSSSELFISSSPPLVTLKTPLQVALKVAPLPANIGTSVTSHQDQQTIALPCTELLLTDGSDDNLVEAGVSRAVNDASLAPHATLVTSMPGNVGSTVLHKPVSANRLYVRRKANQLVVAPAQPADFMSKETESNQAGRPRVMPGHYFKRKTNQLVRSNSGKERFTQNVVQDRLGSSVSHNKQGGGISLVSRKTRLGRVLRQKKGSPERSSWVWTLSGADVGHTGDFSTQGLRTGPSLFPWKRQNSLRTPVRSQRLRPLPEGKKGSLLFLMSKRLRKVRPVQPVYTRSADGFSLHRSGVMSLGGGNLKWTKSLEKRAKQASEEVTKAVAEAERRKREEKEAVVEAAAKVKDERRAARKAARGDGERIVWVGLVRYKMDATSKTLQRIPDFEGEAGDTDTVAPTVWAKTSPLLTPRRSIIGGTLYLRVGNGNQLVRDPKAASRALASEKVRWSLHNARSRGAKKQQYCQFFTKFGKCNKESGKCPYIHDPDKVAVCTKFLNGNCTDDQCLLTHKVIPERMPDCSFFLEGLCTNESCPYRHVSVNPKAPYCDGFLRGYCKDGDKCNKKHTYVCSVYAETGECLDRSTCKFHHPKKKEKSSAPVSGRKIGTKRKQRYFSTLDEPHPIRQKIHSAVSSGEDLIRIEDGAAPDEGPMEFISLSNMESDEDQKVVVPSQPWQRSGVPFTMKEAGFTEEIEKWIKPTFLLQMSSSPAAAAH